MQELPNFQTLSIKECSLSQIRVAFIVEGTFLKVRAFWKLLASCMNPKMASSPEQLPFGHA